MSKFVEKEISCMMCGHVNTVTILTSATTQGSADLDSRPPEKRRSAMPLWVYQCDHCAAVFSVFEDTPKVEKSFLTTQKYENCDGIAGLPSLAQSFVKIALIYEQAGEMKKAGNYFLNAAWCCDDEKLDVNAKQCRDEALRCWNQVDVAEINRKVKDENPGRPSAEPFAPEAPAPAARPAPRPAELICPSCGAKMRPGSKFCGVCGYHVESAPAPAPDRNNYYPSDSDL